jgi:hypothetical protein
VCKKTGPVLPHRARQSDEAFDSASLLAPNCDASKSVDELARQLTWRRSKRGWKLYAGKRCFGEVVPDPVERGMWRAVLSRGRLSDYANLSWARASVFEAAIRDIEWEARLRTRQHPSNLADSGPVFDRTSPPVRQNGSPRENTPRFGGSPYEPPRRRRAA